MADEDVPEIPEWRFCPGNLVKITFVTGPSGASTVTNLVGRVTGIADEEVSFIRRSNGEPVTLDRSRIRACVVMKEGRVAKRLRFIVTRALTSAVVAMKDQKHVGGNIDRAAQCLAFALSAIPELGKGEPDGIWKKLLDDGVKLED